MICKFNNRVRLEYNNDKIMLKTCCYKNSVLTYSSDYFINNIESCIKKFNELDLSTVYQDNCIGCTSNKQTNIIELSTYTGCNLDCVMCYLNHIPKDEEKNLYIKLMDYFVTTNYHIIPTTLGEPFIFKKEMLKWIDKCNSMYIITNGTLLDKDYIDKLAKYSNKLKIAVSFDSVIKETYEKIRLKSNYDKVVENILYLKKLNLLDQVIYCVQKSNITERKITEDWFSKYNIKVEYLFDLSINSMDYYNSHWIYYDTNKIKLNLNNK